MKRNEATATTTIQALADEYSLLIDKGGNLNAKPHYVLVRMPRHADVEPLRTLPSIQTDTEIDYIVPSDIDLAPRLSSSTLLIGPVKGDAFIPAVDDDWTDAGKPGDKKISDALWQHYLAVENARNLDSARDLLERERSNLSDLYASARPIDEDTPMLVAGLMRETGVSVIYGDFDEFKTTLVIDLADHIAVGAPWQGRATKARPVIWYALEGADEIPIRLRALEARLKGANTQWGDDGAPITVRDRIPEDYKAWRAQIRDITLRWGKIHDARRRNSQIPNVHADGSYLEDPHYPRPGITGDDDDEVRPVIVIDTLSMALGGADEKGPAAVGFIQNCLDLLKERPDFDTSGNDDEDYFVSLKWPVASHVIIIHHQTKTGIEFAGHRAIAANTQGLYRVHRYGKITDGERPRAGQLTPIRVKGIPRPAPLRFEVEIVPVDGTSQTAAILRDRAAEIPKDLLPVIEALCQFDDDAEIAPAQLNDCLDVVAASGAKDGPAKRKARRRLKEKLEGAGIIEPVTAEGGSVAFYRFHDTRVSQ